MSKLTGIALCLSFEDAGKRPRGYTAHMASLATRDGDGLLFSNENYLAIRDHYAAGKDVPEDFRGKRFDFISTPIRLDGNDVQLVPVTLPTIEPIPFKDWPWHAMLAYKLRNGADKGVGSTAARFLKVMGVKDLAELYSMLRGKDCGCGDRAARLDQYYPYREGMESE